MQKQKVKKISVKLILAVFMINIICVSSFFTQGLATTGDLSASVSPPVMLEGNDAVITWNPIPKDLDPPYSYSDYDTEIWMQNDGGVSIKIATIHGNLDPKSYKIFLEDCGTYNFELKEYARMKSYYDRTTYTYYKYPGNYLVTTDNVEVEVLGGIENALNLQVVNSGGHYSATYSFEQEIGASGDQVIFVKEYGGSYSVISEKTTHDAVLFIDSIDSSSSSLVRDRFGLCTEGIVELWWHPVDNGGNGIDNRIQFYLYESNTPYPDIVNTVGEIYCDYGQNGKLFWNDESSSILISDENHLDTWSHIKIQWINSNVEISINNEGPILVSLKNGYSSINSLSIESFNNQDCYIDAIGYSWDPNYNAGDNQQETTYVRTGDLIEISWNVSPYSQGILTYSNYHSIVYKSSDNGENWDLVGETSGSGVQSYSISTDEDGLWKFKVVVYADDVFVGPPINTGYSNGPYYIYVENSEETVEVKHMKFALVVAGNNEVWMNNGAYAVYNTLIKYGYTHNNIYFHLTYPNELSFMDDFAGPRVLDSISAISSISNEYDEVVIYWTAHGNQLLDCMGCGVTTDGLEYIIFYYGLDDMLDKIDCEVMFAFIDSCYSGRIVNRGDWQNGNRIIITSGDWDELCWSDTFTPALTLGLGGAADTTYIGNNDGSVSMHEIYAYTYEKSLYESTNNPEMTPQHVDYFIGTQVSDWDNWYINDGVYS